MKKKMILFGKAVRTSTHNLCFGAKIRKIGIPLHTTVCYIKVGSKGVYITRTCFRDDQAIFLDTEQKNTKIILTIVVFPSKTELGIIINGKVMIFIK